MDDGSASSGGDDLAAHGEQLALRRKRVRFRSCHRGMKELDVLLGRFVDRHLDQLTPVQLDRYESLIESPDPDLYRWILGRGAPPAIHDTDVMALLRDIRYSPQ